MKASVIPQGTQLDMFGQDMPLVASATRPSKEGLRNHHVVASCGEAAFEYLLAYALKRGLQAGPPTQAGQRVRGKLVSLLILGKQVVRADYAKDVHEHSKRRRLSAARFCRLCDAHAARKGVAAC